MIFYFSGTGNSQLAAKQIASVTGDELVSINRWMKAGKTNTFRSDRPLVFVAPTYAWRMPRVVEQWIRDNRFEGDQSAYFLLTCGGGCGNAAAYAKKLCAEKHMRFQGLASVVMPENYLAMFATPGQAECKEKVERAMPEIAALAGRIQKGQSFPEAAASLGDKALSGPVNPLFYRLFVQDKGFTVSEACVACGKCAERCPLNNIELIGGRPVWKGDCTHCMACIGGCPTEAIEYKNKSKGQHRHYVMDQ